MITYHKLVSFSNKTCKLNNKIVKIGELSDDDLDKVYFYLNSKYKLTNNQKQQLNCVKYIRDYRSIKNLNYLIKNNFKTKKEKYNIELKADIICKWLMKHYK